MVRSKLRLGLLELCVGGIRVRVLPPKRVKIRSNCTAGDAAYGCFGVGFGFGLGYGFKCRLRLGLIS